MKRSDNRKARLLARHCFGAIIMSQKSVALRIQRNTIVQNMHDATEGTFDAAAQTRWAELDKQQDALRVQIEAMEKSDKLNAEMSESRDGHKETAQPSTEIPTFRVIDKVTEKRSTKEYNAAFEQYIRTAGRVVGKELEEVRSYSGLEANVSAANGEFLVPIGFQKDLEIKLKAYGGMRNVCKIINTSTGNQLQWPTMDDTQQTGEWLSENNPIGQANPTFDRVTYTAWVASSKQVLVSVQLLQDSAFDVQSLLSDAMGIRLGRRVNNGYTVGTGSGTPAGILDPTVGVPGYNSGSQVRVGVGANSTNNPGSNPSNSVNIIDDLDALITAVDPAYRPGAKFMAHQSTLDTFRKQKDGFGRTLWNVSVSEDEPDTIYGYEYQWNQDMSQLSPGPPSSPPNDNYTVLFGNFEHYVIRDVGPATFFVFQETYMANLQKGYQCFLRTDGQLLQPAAFSVLNSQD